MKRRWIEERAAPNGSREEPSEYSTPPAPASWFLFGTEREIASKPIVRRFTGESLVAFRTHSGRIGVLSARCSHMQADLGLGQVEGERLLCPYHRWGYEADGRCTTIPGSTDIPAFARQRSHPVAVRDGLVFFFRGPEVLFPLPSFEGASPGELVAGRAFAFEADCPWHLIAGNAFDLQHLRPVHSRRLLEEPVIDTPSPFSRRIRYRSLVIGLTSADRWVRRLAGDTVAVSITAWAGNLVLVEARFPRLTSQILVAVTPEGARRCRVSAIVFRRRSRNAFERWAVEPLSLAVRRALTKSFLLEDITRLAGTAFDSRRAHALDAELVCYVEWLAALPRALPGARADSRPEADPFQLDPFREPIPCRTSSR